MLKLKLQYFGYLMRRTDSLEKTLMLGKTEGRRRRRWQRMRGLITSLTQWTWASANSGRWWRTGKPGVLQPMGSQRAEHDWVNEQQQILGSLVSLEVFVFRNLRPVDWWLSISLEVLSFSSVNSIWILLCIFVIWSLLYIEFSSNLSYFFFPPKPHPCH